MSQLDEMQKCLQLLEKLLNGLLSGCKRLPQSAFRQAQDTFRRFQTISQSLQKSPTPFCVELPAIQLETPERSLRERDLIEKFVAFSKKTDVIFRRVILHGSLASGGLTNYSDVDSLLIVADQVFFDSEFFFEARRALGDFQKEIFEFDPLQHHGFHIIPEAALHSYPTSYLPFSVFEEAKAVGLPISLELIPIVSNPDKQRREAFNRLANAILITKSVPKTAYQAKVFLSTFMLVPTLALQAKGYDISKKRSFAELSQRFTEVEWEPMAWATHMRNVWPRFELSRLERAALAACNPWLVSRILLMRRPLPKFFAKEWKPQRQAALLEFVRLASRHVKIDTGIVCEAA